MLHAYGRRATNHSRHGYGAPGVTALFRTQASAAGHEPLPRRVRRAEVHDLLLHQGIGVGQRDTADISEGADLFAHMDGIGKRGLFAAAEEFRGAVALALVEDDLDLPPVELEMG